MSIVQTRTDLLLQADGNITVDQRNYFTIFFRTLRNLIIAARTLDRSASFDQSLSQRIVFSV